MSLFAWTFPGGKLVQDVTSITLADNTAKTVDKTVRSGKRWILFNIKITNPDDVTRSGSVVKWKEAAKTNKIKDYDDAFSINAGEELSLNINIIRTSDSRKAGFSNPEILEAGNTIEVIWEAGGASTGGTDADGLVLEYLEVDI